MSNLNRCIAAIDFGTSNSAVCLVNEGQTFLVPLEHGRDTIPTAVFYNAEQRTTAFGRQALAEYEEGSEGRLMRSLKSLLGSELLGETTLIGGKPVAYRQIIGEFLAHLKEVAESHASCRLTHLVLGRPVHFVDDDEARDRLAENTLTEIAREIGFDEVRFQFEPIAAALDFEATLEQEELVLVVDIGGGTSDFSLVRLGPALAGKTDRSGDVLANDGIHLAGTDFDQKLSLSTAMRELGYGSAGSEGKPVPVAVYHDLATWHKINFLYTWKQLASAEELKLFMGDLRMHRRLMSVLRGRQGHRIASQVENAKIAVAEGGASSMDLSFIESGLTVPVSGLVLSAAIDSLLKRIVQSALDAVKRAGIAPDQVTVLYFTGGSTGIAELRRAFQKTFPLARIAVGDKFASVARGLGASAAKLFAGF